MSRSNSGSLIAGGARAVSGMRQRSQLGFAGMYPATRTNRVARADEFQRLMQGVARRLLPYAATRAEAQTLSDIAKGRYRFAAQDTMQEVASRAPECFMLEAAVRADMVKRVAHQVVAPFEAIEHETKEQCEADVAVTRWMRDRTPEAAQVAVEELAGHAHAIRVSIDALTLAGAR